jgi:phosphoribosyl 1,2-cyclic phosphodiesterase
MKLTIWGARGSISVSGPMYNKYGGDTTCAEIETKSGEVVILDAGTGLRALGNQMLKEKRKEFHFLLTHAHWDHLMGLPFFKPLYRKDSSMFFHGCTFSQQSVRVLLENTMRAPFFPVDVSGISSSLKFDEVCHLEHVFCGLTCLSVPLSHPNNGFGFRLSEEGKSVVFIPDNELSLVHPGGGAFEDYVNFCEGADVLMHDAEYRPEEYLAFSKGWGHSIFLDTVRLGAEAKVKKLILWHINQDRFDDAADKLVEEARAEARRLGAGDMVVEMARQGMTVEL